MGNWCNGSTKHFECLGKGSTPLFPAKLSSCSQVDLRHLFAKQAKARKGRGFEPHQELQLEYKPDEIKYSFLAKINSISADFIISMKNREPQEAEWFTDDHINNNINRIVEL